MRYRVTFAKRFNEDGQSSDIDPTQFLDVADGVVQDKALVEGFAPDSVHSQEVMDEDDGFLGSAAAEVWEFEVADNRKDEFVTAIVNSGTVLEWDEMDGDSDVGGDLTGDTEPVGTGASGAAAYDDHTASARSGDATDDLTVHDAGDPNLGLTDIGSVPAGDWAANTGPTRTGESGRGTSTKGNTDRSSTLSNKG